MLSWHAAVSSLVIAVVLASACLFLGTGIGTTISDNTGEVLADSTQHHELKMPESAAGSPMKMNSASAAPDLAPSPFFSPLAHRPGAVVRGLSTVWQYSSSCADPLLSTVYDCVARYMTTCAAHSGCVSDLQNDSQHSAGSLTDRISGGSKSVTKSIFALALGEALDRNVSVTILKCNKTMQAAQKLLDALLEFCKRASAPQSAFNGTTLEALELPSEQQKLADELCGDDVLHGSLTSWTPVFIQVNATLSMNRSINATINCSDAPTAQDRKIEDWLVFPHETPSSEKTLVGRLAELSVVALAHARKMRLSATRAPVTPSPAPLSMNALIDMQEQVPPWCDGINYTAFRIAFVGDSISIKFPQRIRTWVHAHCSSCRNTSFWPSFRNFAVSQRSVQRNSPISIFNTTLFNESLAWSPNLVFLLIGSNDGRDGLWTNTSAFGDDFEHYLRAYLESPSRPVVLVATPPPLFGWQYFNSTRRKSRRVFVQEKKIIGYTEVDWSRNVGNGVVPTVVQRVHKLMQELNVQRQKHQRHLQRLHLLDLNRIVLQWLEKEAVKIAVTRAGASSTYGDNSRPVNETLMDHQLAQSRSAPAYYGSFPLYSPAGQSAIRNMMLDGVHPGKLMQKQIAVFVMEKLFSPISH